MSSSRTRGSKILGVVREVDAKDFLVDLANLAERDSRGVSNLMKTFHEMFCPETNEQMVFAYQRELRKAWDAPDQRTRDWYIFTLRSAHARREREFRFKFFVAKEDGTVEKPAPGTPLSEMADEFLSSPPPAITPFEAVLVYFQLKIGDRAKHCAHADCQRPYFIADKRWQKFCSEKCAGPANREAKRKWWHENRGKGGRLQ